MKSLSPIRSLDPQFVNFHPPSQQNMIQFAINRTKPSDSPNQGQSNTNEIVEIDMENIQLPETLP
jgi:hypothetical protein